MGIIDKYRALKLWISSSKYGVKYAVFKEKMNDQKLSRELVGEDRLGNKYYQYYSPWGLPTRREVDFINKRSFELNDQAFYFWLNKRNEAPPTELEIQQYYLEEAERKMKALEWDKKERLMMEAFYQQRFKVIERTEVNRRLGLEEDETDRIKRLEEENLKQNENNKLGSGSAAGFEPAKWNPTGKGRRGGGQKVPDGTADNQNNNSLNSQNNNNSNNNDTNKGDNSNITN